jgi:transmembrane sensor
MTTEQEAADWFARIRAPDAEASRDAFLRWYDSAGNAAAYDRHAQAWDQAKFLANTHTARSRNLANAARRPRRSWLLAAAAIAGIVAAATAMVAGGIAPRDATGVSQHAVLQRDVRDAPRTVDLADGSRVVLDRGARLEVAFSAARRDLRLLAGRARFEVAHDGRPFVVAAGGGQVIARGTIFDVAVTPDVVVVALIRGAVDVRSAEPGSGPKARRLAAGQRVVVRRTGIDQPAPIAPGDVQWTRDMIVFDDAGLAQALAAFNRTSPAAVEAEGLALSNLRISGAFKRSDPQALARQVAATFGLAAQPRPNGSWVLVQPAASPENKIVG